MPARRADSGLGSAPPTASLIFGFALFPPRGVFANNEEIGCMHDAEPLPVGRTVIQLDGRNLIVILSTEQSCSSSNIAGSSSRWLSNWIVTPIFLLG